MDPSKLKISNITASEPKIIEKGSNKFCLIPLQTEDEKSIQLKFTFLKLKIFEHENGKEKPFSLGINLRNEDFRKDEVDFMEALENKIQDLAMESKSSIKKLHSKFANFTKEDFYLIKTDKSLQPKIWGRLYHKIGKITCPFWELIERKKGKQGKMKIDPLDLIGVPLMGDVVVEIKQIFCGNIKSITCIVKEVLIRETVQPPSHFEEFEVNYSSDDECE